MPAFCISYCRVTAMTECPAKTTYDGEPDSGSQFAKGRHGNRGSNKKSHYVCSQEAEREMHTASFLLRIPFGAPAHELVLPTVKVNLLPPVQPLWSALVDVARRGFSW